MQQYLILMPLYMLAAHLIDATANAHGTQRRVHSTCQQHVLLIINAKQLTGSMQQQAS
jgi:hypothetical protein